MATYIIGDVHGQFDALMRLLSKINYKEDKDELWFVGDLVNRGPQSLEVLRFVVGLGVRVKVVLGNHDFSLMVQALELPHVKIKKSSEAILKAPDSKILLSAMRSWPLFYENTEYNVIMAHAGFYPFWSIETARMQQQMYQYEMLKTEKESNQFLEQVYANGSGYWNKRDSFIEQMRFTVNAFLRMRFLEKDGRLNFDCKLPPEEAPTNLIPWFEEKMRENKYRYIFGHWAACGLKVTKNWACLDSGAAWGGGLTAFNLEKWEVTASVRVREKK